MRRATRFAGAARAAWRVVAWSALGLATTTTAARRGGAQAAAPRPMINQSTDPLLASFRFRSIGPASMGGRIDDVEVAPSDPDVMYIAYATGGVFKSVNNGTTFSPIFDTYGSSSIGDIAIHPRDPDILYVGTGEANNRQSSSFGDGMYKTTDGGKTFTHIGLRETQTIARVVIDPRDPEVVYVAAVGHLFGPNKERGLYKTTDGGRKWTLVKYIDEDTGFTDLVMDPSNSQVLYAASYQRRRTGCCFNGGGPGSAIWKTTDAGATWTKLAGGLPPGPYGRIAIDVARSNPSTLYAQIEAGDYRLVVAADGPGAAATRDVRPTPNAIGEYWTSPGGDAGRYWCSNASPRTAASVAAGLPLDAEPLLDPTQGGVFRSDDGGETWTHTSNCNVRPMYFSQVRVDPLDPNTVYLAGGVISKSHDGGKTFSYLDAIHVDFHALWISPTNPRHIIVGNDGGVNISYDRGATWDFVNSMAAAQAYAVTADDERPYNVYAGLQDNGNWGGPSTKRGNVGIHNGDWFKLPCVGDGFVTAVNRERPNIVYCEGQDGATQRVDLNTGVSVRIKPVSGPAPPRSTAPCDDGRAPNNPRVGYRGGERNVLNAAPGDEYRFNWNTPYVLSSHNQGIVYLGGNRLFKSHDGGDTWTASADLTRQLDRCRLKVMGVSGSERQLAENDGVEWYGTIVSVSESRAMPGVVWAGTDDGRLHVSRDGGATFTDVSANLPGLQRDHDYWTSRIDASHFDAGTAYVAVDGHRSNDFRPHLFVTRDYGRTFASITTGLPEYGPVLVVREDPRNRDLLFAGTEFGLFASLDGGKRWGRFMNDYPTVRTDDILIHPREGDLVVATHGRGIYIADDITALQQFSPEVAASEAHLFQPREAVAYLRDITTNRNVESVRNFIGENAPVGASLSYYLRAPVADEVRLTVTDHTGRVIGVASGPRTAGIHTVRWAQLRDGGRTPAVTAGAFTVRLEAGGRSFTQTLQVLEDKWFKVR